MKDFFEQLMETPLPDDGAIDGVISDETTAPVKESAFAVSQEDVGAMKALLGKMAVSEDIPGAVNREALAEATNRKITRIPVAKVTSKEYYRVNPDKDYYRVNVPVIEHQTTGGSSLYLLSPDLQLPASVRSEMKHVNIYTGMTATRDVFLLYVVRSDSSWFGSAMEKVRTASRTWIKVKPNMKAGGYDYYPAQGVIPDPVWSDLPPFEELMALGFKDKIITSDKHRVISQMLGLKPDELAEDDGIL